jgi:membrane-bound metal-dependent hydrolase YbcI (DUF457 family)
VTHAGCGLAVGGIFAPLVKRVFGTPYRVQYPLSFIGAVIPDIDGLSLLFDHAAYFGNKWYSHHMFFHSIAGALLMSVIVSSIYCFSAEFHRRIRSRVRDDKPLAERIFSPAAGAGIVFFLAYIAHLFGDMVCPPGPWNGIALFWPFADTAGGWGRIYWHNWYFIYLSIVFIPPFAVLAVSAGIFSASTNRITRRTGKFIRAATVFLSLNFAWTLCSFIATHSYAESGFAKWDALQRSHVPSAYLRLGDKCLGKAGVLWKKEILKGK